MTRKSKREIERALDDLPADDDEDAETVLVIGGDAERAGWMTPEEYRERFDAEEREKMVSSSDLEL